jgi:transcriptional regulator with XRE-family HTH domain
MSPEQLVKLGLRLRHKREELGYTQHQIADELGVSDATITLIEQGKGSGRSQAWRRYRELMFGAPAAPAIDRRILDAWPHLAPRDRRLLAELAERLAEQPSHALRAAEPTPQYGSPNEEED